MIDLKKYNLEEVDKLLGDNLWSPVDVANINDWVLRAAAVKGEFHWHSHDDDEFFLIYKGEIVIEIDGGKPINLKENEGAVIPAGIRHKPRSENRSVVLLLEPKRLNTEGENL